MNHSDDGDRFKGWSVCSLVNYSLLGSTILMLCYYRQQVLPFVHGEFINIVYTLVVRVYLCTGSRPRFLYRYNGTDELLRICRVRIFLLCSHDVSNHRRGRWMFEMR